MEQIEQQQHDQQQHDQQQADQQHDQQPEAQQPEAQAQEAQAEAQGREQLGRISYSELAMRARASIGHFLAAPVYLPAFNAEGSVRVLSSGEELEVLARLEAPQPDAEGGHDPATPEGQAARRKHRNRLKMLLALSLSAVEPSFSEEEAAAALEAPDSTLFVDPLFHASVALNPVFQLEFAERPAAQDAALEIVKAQTKAAATLYIAREGGQLPQLLGRALWHAAEREATQAFTDHVELVGAILGARPDFAERLARDLAPHLAAQVPTAEAPAPPSKAPSEVLAGLR